MLTIFGKTMESLIATEFRCCQTLRDFWLKTQLFMHE
jgi:hypothetical protein